MIPRSPVCVAPVEYPLGNTSIRASKAGNIRLGFLVASNILAAGEQFDVNYAIQNNSSNRIDRNQGRAVFHLIEEVRFGLDMNHPAISRTILSSKWFEHFDPSPSVEQNDSVSVRACSSTTVTDPQILEQLRTIMNSPRSRFTLEVPTNTRPTINGKFIRVHHYVKMVMLTRKRHELVTGLTIYRPVPAANDLPAAAASPSPLLSSFSSCVKQQTTVFPYQQLQHQESIQQQQLLQFQRFDQSMFNDEEIATAEVSITGCDYTSVAELVMGSSYCNYGEEDGGRESGPNDSSNIVYYHNSNRAPTDVFIPTVVATGRVSCYSQQQPHSALLL
jgi:hypothetical protein